MNEDRIRWLVNCVAVAVAWSAMMYWAFVAGVQSCP